MFCVYIMRFKGELNAKTNLFLFESIGILDQLCEVFFEIKVKWH